MLMSMLKLNRSRVQVVPAAKESPLLMLSTTVEDKVSLAEVLEALVVHKAVATGVAHLWQHQQASADSELDHLLVSVI